MTRSQPVPIRGAKTAFLFPGQGAQVVGMGKELYETNPKAKELYERANKIIGSVEIPPLMAGFDIAKLCFTGPDTELNKTNISQPAILVTSLAMLEVFKERADYKDCEAAAGLSLGEYTALVAVDALSFDDAVHIVERRGTFMQQACELKPGAMASVIGLDRKTLEDICSSINGIVVVANLNSPGQVVISGETAALEKASLKAKEAGAKRAIPLKVAGAFHSPLMKPAEEKLRKELDTINIKTPLKPIVSNVTADYVRTPDEIKDCLARQVTSPVLWEDSMRRLVQDGYTGFYEIGPGNVLSGLMQRIVSDITVHKV